MCAPTHIRTHGHTAMPTHSILNWLNTPRLAQGLRQSNFGLSSPHQWRINDFYKNSPSKILLFHAKSLILQCSIIMWQSRKLFHKNFWGRALFMLETFGKKICLWRIAPCIRCNGVCVPATWGIEQRVAVRLFCVRIVQCSKNHVYGRINEARNNEFTANRRNFR